MKRQRTSTEGTNKAPALPVVIWALIASFSDDLLDHKTIASICHQARTALATCQSSYPNALAVRQGTCTVLREFTRAKFKLPSPRTLHVEVCGLFVEDAWALVTYVRGIWYNNLRRVEIISDNHSSARRMIEGICTVDSLIEEVVLTVAEDTLYDLDDYNDNENTDDEEDDKGREVFDYPFEVYIGPSVRQMVVVISSYKGVDHVNPFIAGPAHWRNRLESLVFHCLVDTRIDHLHTALCPSLKRFCIYEGAMTVNKIASLCWKYAPNLEHLHILKQEEGHPEDEERLARCDQPAQDRLLGAPQHRDVEGRGR